MSKLLLEWKNILAYCTNEEYEEQDRLTKYAEFWQSHGVDILPAIQANRELMLNMIHAEAEKASLVVLPE